MRGRRATGRGGRGQCGLPDSGLASRTSSSRERCIWQRDFPRRACERARVRTSALACVGEGSRGKEACPRGQGRGFSPGPARESQHSPSLATTVSRALSDDHLSPVGTLRCLPLPGRVSVWMPETTVYGPSVGWDLITFHHHGKLMEGFIRPILQMRDLRFSEVKPPAHILRAGVQQPLTCAALELPGRRCLSPVPPHSGCLAHLVQFTETTRVIFP